jgi:integrase
MASIITRPNGTREVRFTLAEKVRTIRLGDANKRTAETVKMHVERLVSARLSNGTIPDDTSCWLAGVGDELHNKLAAAGLTEPRHHSQTLTIKTMVEAYTQRRTDLKPSSIPPLKQARDHMLRIFGDVKIDTITPAMADDFKRTLNATHAEATTAKCVINIRRFFRDAVRRKLLVENPFGDVSPGSQINTDRAAFIDHATIRKVMEATPDPEWKLLIALSRFGGLRIPSEPLALTWNDIDFDKGRITVRASKTEHHAGKGIRVIPMFPELRPHLQAAFDRAEEGEVHVITKYRTAAINLRTQFERIISRAGVTPWPRLWHNLRASRQTELANEYPAHVVCKWLGNSELIAAKHYLQVQDEHFDVATNATVDAHQKAHQQVSAPGRDELKPLKKTPENAGVCDSLRHLTDTKLGDTGFEPVTPRV